MHYLKSIILVFLLIIYLFPACVFAQDKKLDSLAENLFNNALKYKSSSLYVHFDKNVYTNNDQVWFTGYLTSAVVADSLYNTLFLSLVNDEDTTVCAQHKFLINNGYAFGSFKLPDSLQSGTYRFVVNTNIKINGQPDGEFIQPITIKSTTINPMIPSLSIFKNNDENTGNGTVLLKAVTSDNRFVNGADIEYHIGTGSQILKSGKAKTSVIGEYMIDYPADKINAENNLLHVSVSKNKILKKLKFYLPYKNVHRYLVNFYPEGGYLVTGLQSKIGFEIKDELGVNIKAKGVLFENNQPIDTISSNSIGLGSFSLNVQPNANYTFKLLEDGIFTSAYSLPKALSDGIVFKLNSAIGNNELFSNIESNTTRKIHVLVHNGSTVFLSSSLILIRNRLRKVILKLDSVPIGLNTITILDSLYKPLSERIFFAHYDKINHVKIETDKQEYTTRDKVELKLKAFQNDTNQVGAIISMAVVQANRISVANQSNIIDYTYLEHELKQLPINSSGLKYDDLNYLEYILLVKSWRKYKWPEEEVQPNREQYVSTYELTGSITRKNSQLKKPIAISLIAGKNLSFIVTDSTGRFTIPYKSQVSDSLGRVWLNLNVDNYDVYTVKLNDPLDEFKNYIKKINYQPASTQTGIIPFATENVTSLSGINLKDVTIRQKREDMVAFINGYGINKCGDYVCMNGILNCQNHIGGGQVPIKGKTYYSNGRKIIYPGCAETKTAPNIWILKSISLPKDFYVSDITNKNEPINYSTIYWNYQLQLSPKDETLLSFNTGDLIGNFKIIVQGITQTGVVYGEKEIKIVKQ